MWRSRLSSTIKNSKSAASTFNERAAELVFGKSGAPASLLSTVPKLLDENPGLRNDPASEAFSTAVKGLQRQLFGKGISCDGMLGRATWTAILKHYDFVEAESDYWVMNGRRLSFNGEGVKFINFDQQGGLDLHKFGHFSTRKQQPRMIVVHWGGLNPKHCYEVFSDPARAVSSHAGIGVDEAGNPTVYQYLDLQHSAWHAGVANSESVGIDICQQPALKWQAHYTRAGYDVSVMNNETGRGNSRVLTLDPRVAHATRMAIRSLCDVLNIPMTTPRNEDGSMFHGVLTREQLANYTGVIGHHHVVDKKWDCACWWDAIWSELPKF